MSLSIGIGLGLSFGGGPGGMSWEATSGAPGISLLPSGILAGSSHGSPVTGWRHAKAGQADAVVAGTPTLYLTDGIPGVLFDNANQLISGTCAGLVDDDVTLFLVCKLVADSTSYIFQLSAASPGADDVMPIIARASSTWRGSRPWADNGQASNFDPTPVDAPTVYRFDATAGDGAFYRNGTWKGGSAIKIASGLHTGITFAIGNGFAKTHPFGGVVYAALAYHALPEIERLRIDKQLRTLFGLAEPYLGAVGPVLNPNDPPRYLLPVSPARIYSLPNEPVEIFKRAIVLYDGDAPMRFTSSATLQASPPDRCTVLLASGTATVTATCAGGSATATIESVAEPVAGSIVVNWTGDSNGARPEAIQRIKDRWGSKVSFMGDAGPEAGYSQKYSSRDSATFATFNTSGSPYWNGGAAFDIAGFVAANGGVMPTDIIWICGHNAANGLPYADVDAAMAADFVHAEAITAAWKAASPTIRSWFVTYFRENGDDSFFANHAAWWVQQQNDHRVSELMIAQFGGREADLVYLVYTAQGLCPANDREDVVHINKSPGGLRLARMVMGALAKHAFP